MAGRADGEADSEVILDAKKRHNLVVKGRAQHTRKDYGSRGQRGYAAKCFGYVDGDRRGDGFRNERDENLLAGTEGFAAEVNDENGCHCGDGDTAGDSGSFFHDNLAVFIQRQRERDGCRAEQEVDKFRSCLVLLIFDAGHEGDDADNERAGNDEGRYDVQVKAVDDDFAHGVENNGQADAEERRIKQGIRKEH